jgi:hypothetical protein
MNAMMAITRSVEDNLDSGAHPEHLKVDVAPLALFID